MAKKAEIEAGEKEHVDVLRTGDKIIVPEDMEYAKAIKWLQRKLEEDEEEVGIHESMDAYPLDGAIALLKALSRKYGWNRLVPTPSFFGPRPPTMVSVEVGPNETVQVPWGRIEIPGISGWISPGFEKKDGRTVFALQGIVKQKHKHEIKKIADLTREIIMKESIYRGKAIVVASFEDEDPDNFDPNNCPKFMDLSKVNEAELIFADDVMSLIDTSLFTPIEATDACRKHRIPLKRGILLEGPYGTGKTLTARVAAKKCIDNAWTFIYVQHTSDFRQALYFAKQYQPAMIFAEDIDRITEGARDAEMDQVFNAIDGVELKDSEIIVCLTTNHVEKIAQAMLRPGRLDAVVSVQPPDAIAVAKLLRLYGRGLIPESANLAEVGEKLAGQIPSVVREVVERSKLAAIRRQQRENQPGDFSLTADDLLFAAKSMLLHMSLLKPKDQDVRSEREKSADLLGTHIKTAITDVLGGENGLAAKTMPQLTS